MTSVELLKILAALELRPRERNLNEMAHLRRPASKRFDELAQGQTTGGLRAKLVFMNVLHGARILAAVRRALTLVALVVEPACDA